MMTCHWLNFLPDIRRHFAASISSNCFESFSTLRECPCNRMKFRLKGLRAGIILMYQPTKCSKGLRYASCTLRSFLRLNVVGKFGVIRLHVWNLLSHNLRCDIIL